DDLAHELDVASHERRLRGKRSGRGGRKPRMHASEIATVLLPFQVSPYRDVKHFYQNYALEHLALLLEPPLINDRPEPLVRDAMTITLTEDTRRHLDTYLHGLGDLLGTNEQRANFALYVIGLLSEGERKSVEPMAARAAGDDPVLCQRYHDRLSHFLRESPWSDRDVRTYAVERALATMTREESIDVWIVDDTGFLKQGAASPGVQRQYTGSAGKVANCQLAVSLTVATRTAHLLVDMDLYLPESWAHDVERRRRARIPDVLTFRTKHEIALDLIATAVLDGVPKAPVTADAWYGDAPSFRGGLTALGFRYCVDVNADTRVVPVDDDGNASSPPTTVRALAAALPAAAYRVMTWREGTRGTMRSRFARVRVQVVAPDAAEPLEQTLLIEWPASEREPTHVTLCTLPVHTAFQELVRITKQRWRTERVYEDTKGELGLDHFEGRSYVGWQHHASVVLVCYAFVQTALRRSFPPSTARAGARRANRSETRAS
ncbi:MAG TPA: IS701 family transposase, partial [Myxococcaceae bacterium]|nr:IS701 family transposase [Myxococcaceae bacterium]